jgi:hypothetical protein
MFCTGRGYAVSVEKRDEQRKWFCSASKEPRMLSKNSSQDSLTPAKTKPVPPEYKLETLQLQPICSVILFWYMKEAFLRNKIFGMTKIMSCETFNICRIYRSSKWSLTFRLSDQNFVRISYILQALYFVPPIWSFMIWLFEWSSLGEWDGQVM